MEKVIFISVIWITLLINPMSSKAQLDQFIIGSLGGNINNAEISLLQSIGDLVGTHEPELVDQGFAQCFQCNSCSVTGIASVYNNSLLRLWPNPTNELIFLDGPKNEMVRFELLENTGKLISKGIISNSQIHLSKGFKGLLLLKVYGANGELTLLTKVVKF